jgi:hypothetical protein
VTFISVMVLSISVGVNNVPSTAERRGVSTVQPGKERASSTHRDSRSQQGKESTRVSRRRLRLWLYASAPTFRVHTGS